MGCNECMGFFRGRCRKAAYNRFLLFANTGAPLTAVVHALLGIPQSALQATGF